MRFALLAAAFAADAGWLGVLAGWCADNSDDDDDNDDDDDDGDDGDDDDDDSRAVSPKLAGSALISDVVACLSVCLSVGLSACLPVCLPACLSVCLSVCLYACLSALQCVSNYSPPSVCLHCSVLSHGV